MKNTFLISLLLVGIHLQCTEAQTIQERLGYDKNTKLLIIHADDLGVSHSENIASFEAIEKGMVTSASILVPAPWFSEVAAYAQSHSDADFGIHLCLNSEWKHYKWGAVSDPSQVASLLEKSGFFPDNGQWVAENADIQEMEQEMRAQIDRAIASGITPTHIDAHMMTAYRRADFVEVLLKISQEYKLPIGVDVKELKARYPELDFPEMVSLDKLYGAGPEDYEKSLAEYYTTVLRGLSPGLNEILVHTAYDDAEMQAITVDHTNWGSDWRQQDFDFFTSDACKAILKEENIQLITWKAVQDQLMK